MLRVGDAAPDFAFRDTTLYRVLGEKAGALFFFPKAFTPG
jgi:peroxiredoxin